MLAVPLAIIEPLKVLALLVVGDGHFIAGTLVMIGAYAGSLFVTERLFTVLSIRCSKGISGSRQQTVTVGSSTKDITIAPASLLVGRREQCGDRSYRFR